MPAGVCLRKAAVPKVGWLPGPPARRGGRLPDAPIGPTSCSTGESADSILPLPRFDRAGRPGADRQRGDARTGGRRVERRWPGDAGVDLDSARRHACRIRRTRAMTDRPFGVNLVLQWDQRERVAVCAEESVAVVSTFWGDPGPYVDAIHYGGALHLHTVGSAEEARRAAQAGVDVIVAQGWEAGGRVRGKVATLPLVPAVVDAVAPLPVLAAGGVADGRGLAAVLALGADAGWVGTRFLLAHEASVHDEWRRRIRDASRDQHQPHDSVRRRLAGRPAPRATQHNAGHVGASRAPRRRVATGRGRRARTRARRLPRPALRRHSAGTVGPPEISRHSQCMPARAPGSSPNSVRQPRSSANSHAKPPRHSARSRHTTTNAPPPDTTAPPCSAAGFRPTRWLGRSGQAPRLRAEGATPDR